MKTAKRQKLNPGDVFRIELGELGLSYGRVLPRGVYAFYDGLFEKEISPDEVVDRSILFKIWVEDDAIKSGRWRIVGHDPLDSELTVPPTFFIEEAFDPGSFRIIQDGKEIPATREECIGLERAASWAAVHVEERLRCYYTGNISAWLERMKLK